MASEDLCARVGAVGEKNLTGRLLFCPLNHMHCDSGLSRPTLSQLSQTHLFSCGFFCASTPRFGEDLPARVGAVGEKNLIGRQLFCPLTHLHCDSGLSRPALPQLSQIHLFSCGFFCASTPRFSQDLPARVGAVGEKNLIGRLLF